MNAQDLNLPQNDTAPRAAEKDQVKVQSYKIDKDMRSSYAAGSLIVWIGFTFTFLSTFPTILDNGYSENFLYDFGSNYFAIILDLLLYYTTAIFFFSSEFILNASIGWFIGGFVSALVYGREVPRPSISGTILFISSFTQLLLIFVLIRPATSYIQPYPEVDTRFTYFGSLFNEFDLTFVVLPLVVVIVVTSVLAVVSALGYTIGKYVT